MDSIVYHPIPVGYRFRPTDDEIVNYYLRPLANHQQPLWNIMQIVDIYAQDNEPWKLFDRTAEEPYWVITKLTNKSKSRKNRIVGSGKWHEGRKFGIFDQDEKLIGEKRYFTFDSDSMNPRHGKWIMNEFNLLKQEYSDFVICKIRFKVKGEKVETDGNEELGMVPTKTTTFPAPAVERFSAEVQVIADNGNINNNNMLLDCEENPSARDDRILSEIFSAEFQDNGDNGNNNMLPFNSKQNSCAWERDDSLSERFVFTSADIEGILKDLDNNIDDPLKKNI